MEYQNRVIQYPEEYSLCSGCRSCELLCSLSHDGTTGPGHRRLKIERGKLKDIRFKMLVCQQCDDHPCYDACPKKGEAMRLDEARNIAYIDEEYCIGCGSCQRACRLEPSRILLVKTAGRSKRKARKCDLCRTRPEGPICIQFCPSMCIGMSDDPIPEMPQKITTEAAPEGGRVH